MSKETASPFVIKESDKKGKGLIPTVKSYKNPTFLGSHDARLIRIWSEFLEPAQRLNSQGIKGTILVFGSARAMARSDWEETMAAARKGLETAETEADKKVFREKISKMEQGEWMCEFYAKVQELSRRMTEFAINNKEIHSKLLEQPDYLSEASPSARAVDPTKITQALAVCTGGGPGIMEASNRGASEVKGALSIGMGISLPFEKGLNPYVTPHLAFEFHYFFTRKFWMMYCAKALILGPGGLGTCDELFELMTLRQTGKMPQIPIVLLGKKFWQSVINWQFAADHGTVSQAEVDSLFYTDSVDEAYEFLTKALTKGLDSDSSEMTPQKGQQPKESGRVSPGAPLATVGAAPMVSPALHPVKR